MIPNNYRVVEQDSYKIGDYVLAFNNGYIEFGVIITIDRNKHLKYLLMDLEKYEWFLAENSKEDDEYYIKGKLIKETINE